MINKLETKAKANVWRKYISKSFLSKGLSQIALRIRATFFSTEMGKKPSLRQYEGAIRPESDRKNHRQNAKLNCLKYPQYLSAVKRNKMANTKEIHKTLKYSTKYLCQNGTPPNFMPVVQSKHKIVSSKTAQNCKEITNRSCKRVLHQL